MKKGLIILSFISVFNVFSQKKTTEKVKDTVKTEVVEVVTTYNPKIADANKIVLNPTIKLLEKTKKQPLQYSISSAPVASTFIPKSGVIKAVDVGIKERVYENFIAAGFGNYSTPYFETFLRKHTRFQSEFGFSANYLASFSNIDNTVLDSDFSSLGMSLFYKKDERYFDWKVSLYSDSNQYNWYGIDQNFINNATLAFINEQQHYKHFGLVGEIDLMDAFIDKSSLSLQYFTDDFNSKELLVSLNSDLAIPTDFLKENLIIGTMLEYINGSFKKDYVGLNKLDYRIFTAKISPEYPFSYKDFTLKLGAKVAVSFDGENSKNRFFVFPNVKIQKPLLKENLQIFSGITGDLRTNSYKEFMEENPFISPTILMIQTAERYHAFVGFSGVLNNTISYTVSASFKNEQDKPLFIKNNSKSDGISNTLNGVDLKGYEYGNSFGVVYDNVKTTSVFAELNYEFSKTINFETHVQFDNFTTSTQSEAWNLPKIQANLMAKYKKEKWYATSTVLIVGERKDVLYTDVYPSTTTTTQIIPSFFDININGGYHFNDKLTGFLKVNNLLNSNYQRFVNFEVQGFQILGGITYKFDF